MCAPGLTQCQLIIKLARPAPTTTTSTLRGQLVHPMTLPCASRRARLIVADGAPDDLGAEEQHDAREIEEDEERDRG